MAETNGARKAQHYILGIDLGTTTVKVALLDADSGEVVKLLSRPTKATVASDIGVEGREQDPQKILTALQFCVSSLPKEDQIKVKCIGVSGQMHGVVFWKHGQAWHQNSFGRYETHCSGKLSHLITWEDERCSAEFLGSLPKPDSHLRLSSGHGCASIFWLKRSRPGFLAEYDCAGTIQDFVVSMLCGLSRPLMSPQNAASWGYFNTETNQWNKGILETAGFPVSLLPDVQRTGTRAGQLQSAWYSLSALTPVMVALGDLQCSVLSCLQQDNDTVLNLSTSAQMSFPLPTNCSPLQFDSNCPVECFPYFDGRYVAVAASLTGGNVMAAFITMLQQWTHEFGHGVPESKIWERVLALGKDCHTTDLVITPTLHGERHKPEERASVHGITAANLSLGSVYRALCRGIVNNLHSMLPTDFLKAHGVRRIIGTGTALTRNEVLKQEVEATYGLPIVYGDGSDSAAGVAMAARRAHRKEKET